MRGMLLSKEPCKDSNWLVDRYLRTAVGFKQHVPTVGSKAGSLGESGQEEELLMLWWDYHYVQQLTASNSVKRVAHLNHSAEISPAVCPITL